MNNLTKHEQVWLQAYCAAIKRGMGYPNETAHACLNDFKSRFPDVSTLPKKESVTMTQEEQFKKDLDACLKALSGYPSQDNEGYRPDRGGFKAGWFAALRYERGEG